MELLVKSEMLTSYMDLRLATLKSVSFYLPHNVSTVNQCRKLSCGTVVCKHFASYQGYPNYRSDLIRYAKAYASVFPDIRRMKVLRLSALRNSRLYLPGNNCYSFLLELDLTPRS
jgi:hypothetical protein